MKQSESTSELLFEKNYDNIIYKLYRVSGKFFVDFNVEKFPFDNQNLEIRVQVLQPSDLMKVSFDQSSIDNSKIMEQFKVTGWHKNKFYVTVDNLITDNLRGAKTTSDKSQHSFKNIAFRLDISRQRWSAVLQIILPLFMIGLIAIAIMFLGNQTFQNMGEVSVGIFLTIVAFSIALSEMTPDSNILTKADLLFLLTFMAVSISFLHMIIKNVLYNEDKEKMKVFSPWIKKTLLIAFPTLYFIIIFI